MLCFSFMILSKREISICAMQPLQPLLKTHWSQWGYCLRNTTSTTSSQGTLISMRLLSAYHNLYNLFSRHTDLNEATVCATQPLQPLPKAHWSQWGYCLRITTSTTSSQDTLISMRLLSAYHNLYNLFPRHTDLNEATVCVSQPLQPLPKAHWSQWGYYLRNTTSTTSSQGTLISMRLLSAQHNLYNLIPRHTDSWLSDCSSLKDTVIRTPWGEVGVGGGCQAV